jgi:hypothetical protein
MRHEGVIVLAQLNGTALEPGETTEVSSATAKEEISDCTKLVDLIDFMVPKYVVGVTTSICSRRTEGKL